MKSKRDSRIVCAIDKINALGEITFKGTVSGILIDCDVTNQKDMTYIFDSTGISKENRSEIRWLVKEARTRGKKSGTSRKDIKEIQKRRESYYK